jgi:hypothetical protein
MSKNNSTTKMASKHKPWLVPSEFSDEDGTKMAKLDAWADAMIKKHNIKIEDE